MGGDLFRRFGGDSIEANRAEGRVWWVGRLERGGGEEMGLGVGLVAPLFLFVGQDAGLAVTRGGRWGGARVWQYCGMSTCRYR